MTYIAICREAPGHAQVLQKILREGDVKQKTQTEIADARLNRPREESITLINRPGVARAAVLQTPWSFID